MSRSKFQDRIVIVTGAASGIGRAAAQAFAREGAHVAIVDVDADAGRDLEAALRAADLSAAFSQTDVTQERQVASMVRAVLAEHGRVDVLVNNAGIEISGPLDAMSADEWDRLFAVNVRGVFLCSKYVLPGMKERRQGVIVNTASVAGLVAWPDDTAYSASKGAVVLLTKGMALDYAPFNIRVNCVCPGVTDTPLMDRALAGNPDPDAKRLKGLVHPLGRLCRPEEVAEAMLYLASDAAAFVTGTALAIDGGYTAR